MSKFDKQGLLSIFAPKIKECTVAVPGVDQEITVYVKQLSTAKVFELQKQQKEKNVTGMKFSLLVLQETLVNDDGTPAYTSAEINELLGTNIAFFQALSKVCAEASGLAQPDDGKEKAGNE